MNPTIQSGMHPDAESLTAFAEHQLPPAERDQILTHMAACSRCREVVFLAQRAAGEEQPASVPAMAAVSGERRAYWFRGWRWAWIPVAALAGFAGFAAVEHFRQPAAETQLTAKLSPTDNLRRAEPATVTAGAPPPAAQPSEELKIAKRAKPSEVRDRAPLTDKVAAKDLDEKKSIERRELAVGAAAPPMVPQPGLSGGSIHGTMVARAKSAPGGGPMAANQFQQQNQQQNMAGRQNALQSQRVPSDAANRPVIAGPVPAAASQTVTVQSQAEVSAPAPAQPAPLDLIPMTGQNDKLSSINSAAVSKVQKVSLPTGLGTLSVARSVGRAIALDTAGALFLSKDGGKHWQPVLMQWTGRAVLVRTRQTGAQTGDFEARQSARFELVNDNLQTWVSSDGTTWTLEPLPVK